ncbi:MAG: UbiA family prenyltransferase, partial [Candidatus Anstonellales archaeon]
MNAGFIRNFIRLTRIEHGLVLMLAVATAEIIVKKDLNFLSIPILFSLFVPLLNEIASFSLNDLLDIEADRINRRVDRPLVSGEIKKTTSVLIAIGGYALSIILATFINKVCFLIATVFALLSIAYNYHLKTLPLVGNLYIASSMAIPFLFGNLSVSPYPHPLVLSISLLAFMSGLAREIIKSAEDLEGDIKARKAQTLPALIGVKFSVFLSLVIYILFILSTSIPFAF